MAHRLKINLNSWGHGQVELDGQRIENDVSGIDLHLRAGEPNGATIALFAPELEIEGATEVRLPEETQALLKRLGWTPPEVTS